jgi:hypothetical protein
MTTTDFATDSVLPNSPVEDPRNESEQPASGGAPKRIRGLLFGFASVTVGLMLGIWYVGVRIVSADEIVPATNSSARYLQVASLGPKQAEDSVRSLENEGFRARVQARDENHARILIGPFSNQAEMEQAQRKLQSAGVLAVETAY